MSKSEPENHTNSNSKSNPWPVGHLISDCDIKYNTDVWNLEKDIKYSQKVQSFIEMHKLWRENIMTDRAQSKDLYRTDNIRKKTWRALRQIVTFKAQQLIKSLPNKHRRNPKYIYEKLNTFLSSFSMCEDPKIYYTLLSCMIFLGKKKSYNSIIRRIAPDAYWKEYMMKESKFLRGCNENKKKELKWKQIFTHPILCLAKTLLFREEAMQDKFFIKALGCMPKTIDEETRTRMTIVDDYEFFRKKLLQTVKERFQELS